MSYKGCDLESANEWNKGLQDTLSKFPALKSQFNFVGEIHERNKALKPVISDFYMKAFQEHYPHVDKELLKPSVDKKVKAFMKEMAAGKHTMAQSWMPEQEELKDFCGITLNKTFGGDLNVLRYLLKSFVLSCRLSK